MGKDQVQQRPRPADGSAGRRLRAAVEAATPRLLSLQAEESALPPAPGKWSPREVLGHLVDSASNNHQRFVRAGFQDDLVFPGYAQDAWVELQRYRDAPWPGLVTLWRALNLHLAHVMDALPAETRTRPRRSHNLHEIAFELVPAGEPTTLEYFLHDYVDHLEHHLAQIRVPARR